MDEDEDVDLEVGGGPHGLICGARAQARTRLRMNSTTAPTTTPAKGGGNANACGSWVTDTTALFFLGLVGAAAVLVLWLSPMRDVWTGKESVWVTKSTSRIATGFPYVSSLFNCVLWLFYCTKNPAEFLVPIFVNFAGMGLNLSFTWCYWKFSEPIGRWWVQLHLGVFTAYSLLSIVLWIVLGVEAIGWAAVLVNTLMLFSPLAAAKQVIKTRSTQGMPFLPLLFTFISSVVWFLYGLYLCNPQIMVPNGLGIFFGAVQLLLFRWAKRQEELLSLIHI